MNRTRRTLMAAVAASLMGPAVSAAAHPDRALADSLERAIRSSRMLSGPARDSIAEAARQAALPLDPLSEEESARWGEDLAALVRVRHWPFHLLDRESEPDAVAWIADAVRFAILRGSASPSSTAEQARRARRMPRELVTALRRFNERVHAEWPQEYRDELVAEIRRQLLERERIFGNVFVPEFRWTCGGAPTADTAQPEQEAVKAVAEPDLVGPIFDRLQQAPALRLAAIAEPPDRAAEPQWASAEATTQIAVALATLSAHLRDCNGERSDSAIPTSLSERESALRTRMREERSRDSERRIVEMSEATEAGGTSAEVRAGSDTASVRRRRTHDQALAEAFAGSGIVVEHGTALLPRSWVSQSIPRSVDWRRSASAHPPDRAPSPPPAHSPDDRRSR